jgi:integrase
MVDGSTPLEQMTPTQTVAEVVAAHGAWLAMRRAPGTVVKYTQHLRPFVEWAGARALADITASEIEFEFLGPWSLTVEKPTLRNRIAALKSLYDFAERFDLVERNVMRRIEPPPRDDRGVGSWLRRDEDRKLLDAVATPIERVVVYLLRYTGLRVSEACSLRWDDVDLDQARLAVRESKTPSGRRTIPLPPILVPVLRVWRDHRGGAFVLSTRHGTAMKPQFVWRIVKRVGERVEIEGLHPHVLRRTYGSDLINEGLRLEVVSKLLGHSSTTITEKSYAQLLDETIAREAAAVWGAA